MIKSHYSREKCLITVCWHEPWSILTSYLKEEWWKKSFGVSKFFYSIRLWSLIHFSANWLSLSVQQSFTVFGWAFRPACWAAESPPGQVVILGRLSQLEFSVGLYDLLQLCVALECFVLCSGWCFCPVIYWLIMLCHTITTKFHWITWKNNSMEIFGTFI